MIVIATYLIIFEVQEYLHKDIIPSCSTIHDGTIQSQECSKSATIHTLANHFPAKIEIDNSQFFRNGLKYKMLGCAKTRLG